MRQIPRDIEAYPFDAIVMGAGINGAGIARDASLRGLKVLLLDKGDIASGTTSWSTRLIHGGLRYLEHGEVGLVRESLREREVLFRIAPHLVRPLPIIIPIYAQGKRGPWMIRAGMIAYDLLSFDKSLEHHRSLSREETLRRIPGLESDGLQGAVVYYDAQVEYPERLAVENALAAREQGAVILTYARVDRLIMENGRVKGVEFTDLLDQGIHMVRAPVTVNVAGPWVDGVLASLDQPMKRMIGGTKGSHLVVDPFPGAPKEALYVEALADQRPFFIIPWNGHYLIGTTDSAYDGDLDQVEASEEEINYLIREANRVIPAAQLTRDDILFTYSGVRPLPFSDSQDEKSITRRYFIHDHEPTLDGLISIVGGKLTTYRSLAEQAVDTLFKKLGRRSPECVTARRVLPGAMTDNLLAFRDWLMSHSPLPEAATDRLWRIYGKRAADVLQFVADDPGLREPFSPKTGAIAAEILLSFQVEMAETLCDCLLRRTMVGIGPAAGIGADEAAAKIAQKYLGWCESRAQREVSAYRKYLRRFHPRDLPLE